VTRSPVPLLLCIKPFDTCQKSWYNIPPKLIRPLLQFSANGVMVMACLATVQRSGWRVPDDAAIIGVGDEIFSRYTTPTLTAISILTAEIGRRAADMLLTQINDEPLPETGGLLLC
jgi:DNA-binding LacI/PurR family transcriptional regulator